MVTSPLVSLSIVTVSSHHYVLPHASIPRVNDLREITYE